MSRGECVTAWLAVPDGEAGRMQNSVTPVSCAQYQAVLESLLTAVLSDPDTLSSTDRIMILSAIHTPSVLVESTKFLLHELEQRGD